MHPVALPDNHPHGFQEILHVVVGVETHHIGPHDTVDDDIAPGRGQQPKYLERGKGNMEKEADFVFGKLLPDQVGQHHQLVVVNPDHVVGLDDVLHGFVKQQIGFLVRLEELGFKLG